LNAANTLFVFAPTGFIYTNEYTSSLEIMPTQA